MTVETLGNARMDPACPLAAFRFKWVGSGPAWSSSP
jgi:hypothetical protein